MGTASIKKFIKQLAGTLTEEAALTTSAGAADADKIPALNASGVLDSTIINGTVTSAGVAAAGKTPLLDGTGRLDQSTMPNGIVPETGQILASEALADGDFVNVYNNAGVSNVRKSDGSVTGKETHGYVLASVASAATATVYFEGSNTHLTGLVGGPRYMSVTTPGGSQATAPSGSGQVVQQIGIAYSATALTFEPKAPIVLA